MPRSILDLLGGSPPPVAAPAGAAGSGPPVLPPVGGINLTNRGRVNITEITPPLLSALSLAGEELQQHGIDLPAIITSGKRSKQRQQELWDDRKNNPNPVARPGTSPHEKGLAVDIGIKQVPPEKRQILLDTLEKYGVTRPMPQRDPVHFQLAKSPAAAPAAPSAPERSASRSILDLLSGGSPSAPAEKRSILDLTGR